VDDQGTSAPPDAPLLNLHCGVFYHWVGGSGQLSIYPGEVRFEFDRLSRRLVPWVPRTPVRARPPVKIVRARLALPPMSTGLVFRSEAGSICVLLPPGWKAHDLSEVLTAAGVQFTTGRTVVSATLYHLPAEAPPEHE
jgi:hypothetical protein